LHFRPRFLSARAMPVCPTSALVIEQLPGRGSSAFRIRTTCCRCGAASPGQCRAIEASDPTCHSRGHSSKAGDGSEPMPACSARAPFPLQEWTGLSGLDARFRAKCKELLQAHSGEHERTNPGAAGTAHRPWQQKKTATSAARWPPPRLPGAGQPGRDPIIELRLGTRPGSWPIPLSDTGFRGTHGSGGLICQVGIASPDWDGR